MNTAELSVLCVSSCRPFVRIDLNEVEEQATYVAVNYIVS